jgi:hypothetical protein
MQISPSDSFKEVRDRIAELDPVSVASAAAALALLPENGSRMGRLGHLAVLAGEAASGSTKRITRGQLRELVNTGALAEIAAFRDDPFEDVLVEEMAFAGGPRRVGAGLAEDSVYVLRRLVPTAFVSGVLGVEALAEETRSQLIATVSAALALSDRIIREVGPYRHARAKQDDGRLTVPTTSRLNEMSAAVTFTVTELDELVGADGRAVLAPLIRAVEGRVSSSEWIMSGEGDTWPLLDFGDTIVVAQPYAIAAALRHHVLRTEVAELGAGPVALAYGDAVDANVRASLRRLGIDVSISSPRTTENCLTVFSSEIDSGLTLCCAVATDTMTDVEETGIYGSYDSTAANTAAERAFAELATSTSGDVLGLLVPQSAGRASSYAIRGQAANLVTKIISAADLEVFSLSEAGDVLALWKFASESHALHEATKVMCFSTLDLYAEFRASERNLRAHHDATLLTVPPGSGATIRCDAKAGLDRHAAYYVDGTVREVERDDAESWDANIYRVSEIRERRIVRHVSGAGLDLWVRGPRGESGSGLFRLVDTVAYWLSALTGELEEEFGALAATAPCFAVDIDVAEPNYWFGRAEHPDNDELGRYALTGLGVQIQLGPKIRDMLPAADNAGERLLVGMLLDVVDETLVARGGGGISTQRKAEVVDQVAPAGVKKHLLMMPGAGNELMEEADNSARLVQEPDLTAVRQLLGSWLMDEFDLQVAAEIPTAKRREVVRGGVAHLLGVVQAELATFDPSGLLEGLVGASECIIAEGEHGRAIMPARAATYPGVVSRERLREQAASFAQAGVCCRFLVECVSAQPPTGARPWSLRSYDWLMALCAEMLDWAYLDDAYQYEMSENDVLISSAGQLRLVALDRYELGRSTFFDHHLDSQRQVASDLFALRFDGIDDASKPSAVVERVDPVMRSEAGVSLTDLRELLHAANALARSLDVQVVALDRAEAIDELASLLAWETGKVESGVAYLAMGARAELLKPPTGNFGDVVPSRFSRRWSLNRRPFILRGEQLIWGRRQVLAALRVIFSQVFSGRFQTLAETGGLRDVIAAIGSEAGHAFEGTVANLAESQVDKVRRSVKSVSGERISRINGQDLGDIDVLAADRASRLVFAIECKDLGGALTPTEVAGELKEHFDVAPGTSSSKHRERTDWLAARIPQVLAELSIADDPAGWRVIGAFVTSTTVMAPHIKDTDFDIVPARNFPAWLTDQRIASKRRGDKKKGSGRRGRRRG